MDIIAATFISTESGSESSYGKITTKHIVKLDLHSHIYLSLLQLVELKNGETYNGHLVNCDNWMNIQLREVICTSRVSWEDG